MKHTTRVIGALMLGAGLLAAAGISAASVEDTVKMRSDKMKTVGKDVKTINDQLKSGTPDKAAMATAAKEINAMSKEQLTWFPKGSGPESGVKTLAKADIWAKPDDFKKANADFVTESGKLVDVVAKGDTAAITDQVKALGGACGGCHKPFRTPPPPPPGQ